MKQKEVQFRPGPCCVFGNHFRRDHFAALLGKVVVRMRVGYVGMFALLLSGAELHWSAVAPCKSQAELSLFIVHCVGECIKSVRPFHMLGFIVYVVDASRMSITSYKYINEAN